MRGSSVPVTRRIAERPVHARHIAPWAQLTVRREWDVTSRWISTAAGIGNDQEAMD